MTCPACGQDWPTGITPGDRVECTCGDEFFIDPRGGVYPIRHFVDITDGSTW